MGLLFVGIAYIGILLPGVPTTFPALVALWFFSRSSRRLEHWLRYNRFFGRFVRNWQEKRIYPKAGKIAMYVMLGISNILFFLRFPPVAGISFLILSLSLLLWSLPYPENLSEHEELQQQGRRKFKLREKIERLRKRGG